jgi:hypothetical protein
MASWQLSILQKLFKQNFDLLMLFLTETVATLGNIFRLIEAKYRCTPLPGNNILGTGPPWCLEYTGSYCFLTLDPDSESGSGCTTLQ